jgi:hypothetical protein
MEDEIRRLERERDELALTNATLKSTVLRLLQEISLATRRRDGEPAPLNFVPVADAYAAGVISGGKLRELLLLWSRGASREELVDLLPLDDASEHVDRGPGHTHFGTPQECGCAAKKP